MPPSGCLDLLKAAGASVEASPRLDAKDAGCSIDTPVRLLAVRGVDRAIALPDRPVVACRFALRFAEWAGRVAPMMGERRRVALSAIVTGPGWECRRRNRLATGKLSAHATGLAADVAAFVFADRSRIPIAPEGAEVRSARATACELFTTVLGPGSDPYHSDHLHLDILSHGSGGRYRICK